MNVTLTQICAAIQGELDLAVGIKRTMSPGQFKENIPDLPLAQVYPQTIEGSSDSDTSASTFRAGIRVRGIELFIDVFGRARSYVGEDFQKVLDLTDAVIVRLDAQNKEPYFGLYGIKSFKWRAERATIAYNEVDYMGVRFTLNLTVF